MTKIFVKKILVLSFLILSINLTYADAKLERIEKLSKNLRCLICQGQSVYDSQSEFAISVKELIKEKIADGEQDDEIYNYLKIKYGDWIMYEPEVDKSTIVLWILPLILFIFGGLLIFRKVFIKINKKNNV